MKSSSDFLAEAAGSDRLKKHMSGASSADELVRLANDAGFKVDNNSISHAMRSVAGAELKKHGFPDWAINSVLLGEPVCW